MSGFGSSRPGTGPGPTGAGRGPGMMFSGGRRRPGFSPQIDPAKQAASVRFEKSKKDYAKALNKAATTPRSFMPVTTNPGFTQNPDDLYLPKIINAPDEKK